MNEFVMQKCVIISNSREIQTTLSVMVHINIVYYKSFISVLNWRLTEFDRYTKLRNNHGAYLACLQGNQRCAEFDETANCCA